MSIFEAIILAIVEGLTEYLPISSTAHMGFTAALMGMEESEYLIFIKYFLFLKKNHKVYPFTLLP